MTNQEITHKIIGDAIKVHKALGPGLLEKIYQECLFYKLTKSGLYAEKEKAIPVIFEGIRMECGYRLDLLVEGKIVIETKSIDCLTDIHLAQVLTYLKLGEYKHGLLINFNVIKLKDGIRRVINGWD